MVTYAKKTLRLRKNRGEGLPSKGPFGYLKRRTQLRPVTNSDKKTEREALGKGSVHVRCYEHRKMLRHCACGAVARKSSLDPSELT